MVYRQPSYNRAFRCLGGDCPDTCCRDWEIVLDEQALADYRNAPPGLRDKLARSLRLGEDGEVCFALAEDGRCALLTPEGLCAIQRDWGEKHLCTHCGAYPRFTEEYGCLTETALAVSCPEAARLLLESERFVLEESDDGGDEPPFDGVDPELLAGLEVTRARALALLEDGTIPLWRRLAELLELADRCQDCVDFGLYGELAQCAQEPVEAEVITSPKTLCAALMEACAGLEPLRPAWQSLLRRRKGELEGLDERNYQTTRARFEEENPEWERHLINFAGYLVFRHWHKTVNDGLLYGRAALVGAGCLLIYHLRMLDWMEAGQGDQAGEIALLAAFSREVEHLEENLDWLVEAFCDQEGWPFLSALSALSASAKGCQHPVDPGTEAADKKMGNMGGETTAVI